VWKHVQRQWCIGNIEPSKALAPGSTRRGGKKVRHQEIESGSTAWKAEMLTLTPAPQG